LAAASFVDSRLLLWEVATGKAVHEDTDWANGLAISPDSRTLLLETRHGPLAGLHLLDLTTGKRRTIAELDKERIGPGVFSPNGKIAVVLGNNRAWTIDTETAKIVPGVQVDGGTFAIFFTPDGKHLVATSHKTIVRYETANWTATRKEFVWNFSPGWPGAVALSQDGKILAADTTENIKIIDLTKMEIVRSFDRDQPGLLAISRDGTKLAHANQSGGTAEVWNITSGDKLYDFKGHRNYLTGLCFDRSGNTLFTAGADGRLIRWISGNSKKEWQFPGLVRSIQLTPEGRHLMVNNGNGTVYLLRVDELE
jgi:WD40 repeat protein